MPVPPWRERKKTASVRRPLSYEQIVDAAMTVLDSEGVDAMSMRRVAQELGTGAASLYAHVQNKEELVDAVVDRVLATVEFPELTGDWRQDFTRFAYATREALIAHRDVAKALWGRVPTGPNAMRLSNEVFGILRRIGLPDQLAAWAGPLLFDYITADAHEGSLYAAAFGDADNGQQYFKGLGAYFASLPADRFPHVVELSEALTTGGGEERFAFGLDVLLTGLAAKAAASEALGDSGGDT
ncbi:TetR/AcrR family transcriptional regulator [Cryptosporangium aurantiacum]|uniref:Transcriptional regulator, TetR family n=1 Tax=Cryptosporangium aurantiacum TaxID=134849 RepID=A0A1M7RD99_9ACTN|nr:TetR/AcrR family transcriptional regulator [Cryptosporangium aurantiacum]SHN44170.1 transcriptional regulator, TetR family [Cryptosporangium aurantiacum]